MFARSAMRSTTSSAGMLYRFILPQRARARQCGLYCLQDLEPADRLGSARATGSRPKFSTWLLQICA